MYASGLSQPEALAAQMAAAGIAQGQRVRANVRHVRIDKDRVAYFCDVEGVEVLERLGGDAAGALPKGAVRVERLASRLGGYVDLRDVELYADEALHVRGHAATVIAAVRL